MSTQIRRGTTDSIPSTTILEDSCTNPTKIHSHLTDWILTPLDFPLTLKGHSKGTIPSSSTPQISKEATKLPTLPSTTTNN